MSIRNLGSMHLIFNNMYTLFSRWKHSKPWSSKEVQQTYRVDLKLGETESKYCAFLTMLKLEMKFQKKMCLGKHSLKWSKILINALLDKVYIKHVRKLYIFIRSFGNIAILFPNSRHCKQATPPLKNLKVFRSEVWMLYKIRNPPEESHHFRNRHVIHIWSYKFNITDCQVRRDTNSHYKKWLYIV